ncbi:MAG TPA: hypothetical protein VMJ93_17215 [Verrucomicrobiae bacterium]|nr:hypothetical protein [Verrucomicrobiae bacterium]
MRKATLPLVLALAVAVIVLAGWPANSSPVTQASSITVPISTVVTVLGPDYSAPPAISKNDIIVYAQKKRQDVTSWTPAQGANAGLQLAILIDNNDSPTAIGQHFGEIKDFINSQPDTTQVGLFYAVAGSARAAAPFSADHSAVAQKLRLPLGRVSGQSPSIYLSLSDLVTHWPTGSARREVLMIASGVDRLHPGVQSPYVDEAVNKIQKSGVIVHTLYSGGLRLANTTLLQSIAWQNLQLVAGGSGGQEFFQGFETPVDFTPLFRELDTTLKNQYLLTFNTPQSNKKKGEFRSIQIRTELPKVNLSYASRVYVQGP